MIPHSAWWWPVTTKPVTREELMRAAFGSRASSISAQLNHRFFVGSSHPAAYRAGMSFRESDMIFWPARRSRLDEQQRRAVRRRIRETLAVRRAAAAGGQRTAEPPAEPPAESEFVA
jgi:hypothetical protein